jgi:hypothetical protein
MLHKAVGAEQITHLATAMCLRALKAEPAHPLGNERSRHTEISPAKLPMAVKHATLRQKRMAPYNNNPSQGGRLPLCTIGTDESHPGQHHDVFYHHHPADPPSLPCRSSVENYIHDIKFVQKLQLIHRPREHVARAM